MSASEQDFSLHHILDDCSDDDKSSGNVLSNTLCITNNHPINNPKLSLRSVLLSQDPHILSYPVASCDDLPKNNNPPKPTHQLSLREVLLKHGPKIAKAYDDEVVTASWHELECRSISGAHSAAKQILAPYLLEKHNMWFGTHSDQQGTNGRVLHCPICKQFRVPLVCVRDSHTNKFLHFKLNKNHPRYKQYTTAKCNCIALQRQNMIPPGRLRTNGRSLTVYGATLLNHPKVRSLVDKLYFHSFPTLKEEVKNLLLSTFRVPKDAIDHFVKCSKTSLSEVVQCLHIRALYKSQFLYHKLPGYLKKFLAENPSASAALQPNFHSADESMEMMFGRLFVGFPIAEHQKILTLPVLQIDCFHYQCYSYNGVAIILCSKTGFRKSFCWLLASSWWRTLTT